MTIQLLSTMLFATLVALTALPASAANVTCQQRQPPTAIPSLAIGDAVVTEGDNGAVTAQWKIVLSNLVNVGKESGGVAPNQAEVTILNDD